jgi:hypothetical protein
MGDFGRYFKEDVIEHISNSSCHGEQLAVALSSCYLESSISRSDVGDFEMPGSS